MKCGGLHKSQIKAFVCFHDFVMCKWPHDHVSQRKDASYRWRSSQYEFSSCVLIVPVPWSCKTCYLVLHSRTYRRPARKTVFSTQIWIQKKISIRTVNVKLVLTFAHIGKFGLGSMESTIGVHSWFLANRKSRMFLRFIVMFMNFSHG